MSWNFDRIIDRRNTQCLSIEACRGRMDIPYSDDEDCVEHICEQVSRKILKPLRENYGVDTSDAAIRAAVREHNEVCRILTEIGELRKLDIPPITGYEFAVLVLVSYTCPKRLILPLLRETLEEIRTRQVDPEKNYRVRVAVVGSEIDDPNLIKLVESCGALVVADRFCYGSFPGRQTPSRKSAAGICKTQSVPVRVRCTVSNTAMTMWPSWSGSSRRTAQFMSR